MADVRIIDLTNASASAADDYFEIDGVTNGSRKLSVAAAFATQVGVASISSASNGTLLLTSPGTDGAVFVGGNDTLVQVHAFHSGAGGDTDLGLGSPVPLADLVVQSRNGGNGWAGVTIYSTSDNKVWPYLEFMKTRGTPASPLATATNDVIGEIAAFGHTGAAGHFVPGGLIRLFATGAPTSTAQPARWIIYAAAGGTFGASDQIMTLETGLVAVKAALTCTGGGAFTGAVSGTTGTFSGAVSGTSGTFSSTGSFGGAVGITTNTQVALNISGSVAGVVGTYYAKIKNSDASSGAAYRAYNDSDHFAEYGFGGTTNANNEITDTAYFYSSTGGISFCAGSAHTIRFAINGVTTAAEAMRISTNKRLLVGKLTDDTSHLIQVAGGISSTSASVGALTATTGAFSGAIAVTINTTNSISATGALAGSYYGSVTNSTAGGAAGYRAINDGAVYCEFGIGGSTNTNTLLTGAGYLLSAGGLSLCTTASTPIIFAINSVTAEAARFSVGKNLLLGTATDGMTASGSIAIAQDLAHRGTKVGFFNTTPAVKPTVTGSRGGNAALASALTALAGLGLLTDSSS